MANDVVRLAVVITQEELDDLRKWHRHIKWSPGKFDALDWRARNAYCAIDTLMEQVEGGRCAHNKTDDESDAQS